ncbi:MAG: RHS repeat protein, partial [Proteobacteria bacterium]|nr:RHS repeat protein [Pseudomonadota bacterium]
MKVQAETDYPSVLPGMNFVRTYRSNPGKTFSIAAETFTDYSQTAGTPLSSCYSTYYTIPNTSTNVATCLPYISTGQNVYQLTAADGRYLQFSGPNSAVTQNADINERVSQVVNGGVTQWRIKRDDDSVELYTAGGALITKTLRGGRVITYTYSTSSTPASIAPGPGYLIGESDPFGHALSWIYNTAGQMAQMTDPAGKLYQFTYDTYGNLTGVIYPDTTSKTYWYNESANTGGANLANALTGITDESSVRYATYKYASSGSGNPYGLAVNTQHAGGVDSYTFAYNSGAYSGSAITSAAVTDPLGTSRNYYFQQNLSYNYDQSQSQPAASGSGTVTQSESYDANSNPKTTTDYNGNETTHVYDLTRNLETSRTEGLTSTGGTTAQTRTITTTWDPNWRQPQIISVYAGATATGTPLRITTFAYDGDSGVSCGDGGAGALCSKIVTDTSVTPNVTRKWSYTYDTYGRMLTAKGPRTDVNSTTTYQYYTCTTGSQCGQLYTVTDPVGNVTTYNTYNAHGQPLTITDPNGVLTTLTYDLRLRLTSRQVGTELTQFGYWPTGLLKQVTLPDSSYVLYTYDNAHRLNKISDGAGNYIQYALDNMGNRTGESTYDPSNILHRTHTRMFNALNQLYQDINAANTAAVTTAYGYDNNGNQTTIAAPLARNTTDFYDPLNRLSQITDPLSGNTYFGYDANDNLLSVKDPKTLTTNYTYNGFGDLTTQVSPDTGTTTNTYDSGGNLATAKDARNTLGTYSYDAANRVTKIVYSKGGTSDQTLTFGYDTGTYGKGRLTSASDANHSMSWTYDGLGRVTGKGLVVGTFNKSIGYGFTNADLTSIVTPSGQSVVYGYNANHQVTSVTVNGTTVISAVTYEPFGGVNGWTWGNGTTVSRTFNGDGLMSQIVTAGVTLGYTFDYANRIQGISDSSNSTLSWTYGYDLLDRLNSATTSAINDGWTYDANGNRLKQTGTTAITFTVAAASNRITKTTGGLVRTYAYDAVGNVTSNGTSFVYNDRGRMAS